jgi:hypothetical protein
MTYNKSDLKQLPTLRTRNARVFDSIEKNYTSKSIVYCGDYSFTLKGKIAFYKGEFVQIVSAKQLSKHTAEQYSGSIVEYKTLKADQITASFVIRYRKQNGKQYRSKVLTAEQVIEWISKRPYSYTLYTL